MTDEEAGVVKSAGERAADRVLMEGVPGRNRVLAIVVDEFARALVEIEVRRAFRKVGLLGDAAAGA